MLDEPSLALSGPNWEAVRKGWRPGERVQHWLLDDVHFTADDPFMKRYARSNGCPWDARTTAWAVEGGHLDIYRWAVSLGCEASDAVHAKAERLGSSRPNAMAAMRTKLHAWSLMGIAVR